ncbi:hypothetical protein R3P38DRAFT_3283275, partial [Favolaschia claudopus]
MTDVSIARRGLNSERNPNQPLLGSDLFGQHYTLTRDGTLVDIVGRFSRFTYKPLVQQSPIAGPTAMEPFRKDYAKYRAQIIVEIEEVQVVYHDNPLGRERNGRPCTRITAKCPTGSDTDTAKLFDMQVARLQELVDADLLEYPGTVVDNWVTKTPEGSHTIDLMLVGTPSEISMRMDLVPGSDLEVSIALCKDERIVASGNREK